VALPYNGVVLALDVVLLGVFYWCRGSAWRNAALVGGLTAAVVLGLGLGGDGWERLRLCACGVFLHGPLVLGGAAVLIARTSRLWRVLYAVPAAVLVAVAVDAFLVEPTWLEVTHVRIETAKIDRPLRIVVVADFQTDRIGSYERSVLRRAVEQRPDLLLFAGDYIETDEAGRFGELREAFKAACREAGLEARLGVFAIEGNVDSKNWPTLFKGLPVETIVKTRHMDLSLSSDPDDSKRFRLTALSQKDSLNKDMKVPGVETLHIVVGHHPDYALGQIEADVLIAGHTHGGQVWLPWIGPVVPRTRVPRSWASGTTHLEGGRTLVVSRGTGMKRNSAPRMRFLCRPELLVIEIVPISQQPVVMEHAR